MATAAAAVTEREDLTCSVCHELFVTPKLLPCGHVLCRHCLLACMTSHHDALSVRSAAAPSRPPRSEARRAGRTWLTPSDLAMADLVHAHCTLHEQHDCVMCENETATALCVTCGDMFCAACSKFHVKQSVSKHNQVAPLTSLLFRDIQSAEFLCRPENQQMSVRSLAAPNPTHPCYPFFDVWEAYRQVTALPVTRMQ